MAADILEKILAVKREEVAAGKSARPLAALRAEAEAQAPAKKTEKPAEKKEDKKVNATATETPAEANPHISIDDFM